MSRSFTLYDIKEHMADKTARIRTVEYQYDEGNPVPLAITATNEAGERKRLRLIG